MDLVSNKHGSRLDEDLKHDTRGGEQARVPDATADGDPPRARRDDVAEPVEGVVYEPEVDERSELARFVEPSRFPASRDDLVTSAEEAFAPDRLVERLRSLPDGPFGNVQEVWTALGGPSERRA